MAGSPLRDLISSRVSRYIRVNSYQISVSRADEPPERQTFLNSYVAADLESAIALREELETEQQDADRRLREADDRWQMASSVDLGKRFIVGPFGATTALLQQDPTPRAALTMADVLSGLWPECCEQVRLP